MDLLIPYTNGLLLASRETLPVITNLDPHTLVLRIGPSLGVVVSSHRVSGVSRRVRNDVLTFPPEDRGPAGLHRTLTFSDGSLVLREAPRPAGT